MKSWQALTMQFDDETTPTADGDRLAIPLSGAWNIDGKPNGGYLGAIVLRAMRDTAAHPDPLSVTTHFFRPGIPDQRAEVDAAVVRSGRNTTATVGSLSQDGKERIRSVAVFGELTGAEVAAGPQLDIAPPDIRPPDQCVGRTGASQGVDLPILDRVDIRLDPDQATPELGRAEVTGWVRFTDGRRPDTLALPMFADAFPPPLFNLLGRVGWVPTAEMTVHVRRRPVEGWILAQFKVHDLADGRFIEDGLLWDESGSLVAQSRQFGLLLDPAAS